MASRWTDKERTARGAQVLLTSLLQSSVGEKQVPGLPKPAPWGREGLPCSWCPHRAPSHGWMGSIAAWSLYPAQGDSSAQPMAQAADLLWVGCSSHKLIFREIALLVLSSSGSPAHLQTLGFPECSSSSWHLGWLSGQISHWSTHTHTLASCFCCSLHRNLLAEGFPGICISGAGPCPVPASNRLWWESHPCPLGRQDGHVTHGTGTHHESVCCNAVSCSSLQETAAKKTSTSIPGKFPSPSTRPVGG